MATSNRTAVENNKIPDAERLDLVVPRNGSLKFNVYIEDEDEEGNSTGPTDLSGWAFDWTIKTSYEASHVALKGDVTVVGPRTDGALELAIDMSKARALGVSIIDCVHDFVAGPSGGGAPRRIFAGLLELSKGVGTGSFS